MPELSTPEAGTFSAGAELEDEYGWTQLAQKYWLKPLKSGKVKPEVIKNEIWDVLEVEDFPLRSLLPLENSQLLEKYETLTHGNRVLIVTSYLWPGYTDASTNYHVLLTALLVIVKTREDLPSWGESVFAYICCLS